jgi:hypothetical protein
MKKTQGKLMRAAVITIRLCVFSVGVALGADTGILTAKKDRVRPTE